jgi:hypothetical protein
MEFRLFYFGKFAIVVNYSNYSYSIKLIYANILNTQAIALESPPIMILCNMLDK